MESSHRQTFADEVARLCFSHYNQLPKKGKPNRGKEWTLMAAVVMTKSDSEDAVVVSMGTGSKCIGQCKLSVNGDILNDSHAEVLARRAFISYMYDQLSLVYCGKESDVLELKDENRCSLKEGVKFHFFSSHTFCGDASIFPKETPDEDQGAVVMETSQDNIKHTIKTVERNTPDYINTGINKNSSAAMTTSPSAYKEEQGVKRKHDMCDVTNSKIQKHRHYTDDMDKISSAPNVEKIGDIFDKCKGAEDSHNSNSYDKDLTENSSWTSKELRCCKTSSVCDVSECRLCQNHIIHQDSVGLAKGDNLEIGTSNSHHKSDEMYSAGQNDTNKCNKISDIHRTGAKCVHGGAQDEFGIGDTYHTLGAFRTKPGRGDRTLSMSCSDKIARWNVVGCQGALLSHFLSEPIYFETLITGRCPYSETALQRAVIGRCEGVTNLPTAYRNNHPQLLQSNLLFQDSKLAECHLVDTSKSTPSPASIIWHLRAGSDLHDVVVAGKRQGFTKQKLSHPNARSCVCSAKLFQRFIQIVDTIPDSRLPRTLRSIKDKASLTYLDYKTMATDYQIAWKQLLLVFKVWAHKSDKFSKFLPNK